VSRAPNEKVDLFLARELLYEPNRLRLSRFTRDEMSRSRTPDFRVSRDDELVAYSEVKSPRDDALDNLLDEAAPGEIVQLLRNDSVFNRLGRHVVKAATQFDAVNPDHTLPNVLVFVNHDHASSYADMREVLTGMFFAASGRRYPTMMRIAEDWIGSAKGRVDLFVWIDARERQIGGYVHNEISGHQQTISRLFGLEGVRRISSREWSQPIDT
jgi:hypothetical protein